MRTSRISLLYALFASLSIGTNLLCQWITVSIYHGRFYIGISMLIGTMAGLILKYALDKRWIFRYQTRSTAHEARTFALYTVMGLSTTAIFWGTELGFEWLFNSDLMRYAGGLIGLIIGYVVKYLLDKKFVFVTHNRKKNAT